MERSEKIDFAVKKCCLKGVDTIFSTKFFNDLPDNFISELSIDSLVLLVLFSSQVIVGCYSGLFTDIPFNGKVIGWGGRRYRISRE